MSEQTLSRQGDRIHPPVGLFPAMLALGAGGLCIGTGEFAPMSLLPDLARGTGVSIPAAGGYRRGGRCPGDCGAWSAPGP